MTTDESLRRSIDYLRQTSQPGDENVSAAFLSWKRMHRDTVAAAADRSAAKTVPLQQQHQQQQQPQQQQQLREQDQRQRQASLANEEPNCLRPGSGYNHHYNVDVVDLVGDERQQQQEQQQFPARAQRRQHHRGRLLLIIDVQSRMGTVEEVSCREGDNCFDLARDFIMRHGLGVQHVRAVGIQIQAKVREVGHQVDVNGSCWECQAEVKPLTEDAAATSEHLEYENAHRPRSHVDHQVPGQWGKARRRRRDGPRIGPHSRAKDPPPIDCASQDSDVTNGSDDPKPREGQRAAATRSRQQETIEGEGRRRAEARRRRRQRRRSWQDCWSSEKSNEQQWWSASDECSYDGVSTRHSQRHCGEEHSMQTRKSASLQQPGPFVSTGEDYEKHVSTSAKRRFDRSHINEWYGRDAGASGSGNGRVFEDEDSESGGDSFRGVDAIWGGSVLAMAKCGAVSSSDSQYYSCDRRSRQYGAIASAKRPNEYARGRHERQRQHQQQPPRPRTSSVGRFQASERQHNRLQGHDHRHPHNAENASFTYEVHRGEWGEQGYMGWGGEEELSGWHSAPEGSCGRGGSVCRSLEKRGWMRNGKTGATAGVGVEWRSRGVLGRRPASREAVRQLRVSERLHGMWQTMASRKERIRRHRDYVQQAREAKASSGRLKLCSKTRELTDNQLKYNYRLRKGKAASPNGGSNEDSNEGGRAVRRKWSDGKVPLGSKKAGSASGALAGARMPYLDVGDRLYSEGKEIQKKHDAVRRKAEAVRGTTSGQSWSCPKCGVENRAQDKTCQTVTGVAVAGQSVRPDTWCRESTERLGKAAVAAAAAVGQEWRGQGNRGSKRSGSGGGCGDSSGRIGGDGLRRCGRPRPQMFQPTALARLDNDVVRPRPKRELLFDNLYRNSPTPNQRRANQILLADTRASCTFTPAINEKSRRLAEAQETRRMLLDFARSGSESMAKPVRKHGAGESSARVEPDNHEQGASGSENGRGSKSGSDDGTGGSDEEGDGDEETAMTVVSGKAPSKILAKSRQLHDEYALIEQRREQRRKEFLSHECPFTPDIGLSGAGPVRDATTDDFYRRLHDEHAAHERRLQARRYMLHDAPHNSVDPATGQPFFSPVTNISREGQRLRPSHQSDTGKSGDHRCLGWLLEQSPTPTTKEIPKGKRHGNIGVNHATLWQRSQAMERRKEVAARSREERRRAMASSGHVNSRSAELVRAMRVRTLVQTYRTLLASVEFAKLPEGLDYDEAMESITAKINAIFDNDDDSWQEMKLEVAKADPSVLKPELVEVVTLALAGSGDKTLALSEFCELLDDYVERLVSAGGPTSHLFAPGAGRAAAGANLAAAEAAAKAEREESAELREMTFQPKICKKSAEMARIMGRDGTKTIVELLRRENQKSERRRSNLLRQREDLFSKQCPFVPTLFPPPRPFDRTTSATRQSGINRRNARRVPRYSNEIAEDRAAMVVEAAVDGDEPMSGNEEGRTAGGREWRPPRRRPLNVPQPQH